MASSRRPHHVESRVVVSAPAHALFAYVDDHTRLSAHRRQSSWMMAGSRLAIAWDASEGRTVGVRIRLRGRVLGLPLAVEEIVIERQPPLRKVWETTGTPRLLVMGQYRMGYEITPQGDASLLRVFIDDGLPGPLPVRWLGRLFGHCYARWCTQRMADDTVQHFR